MRQRLLSNAWLRPEPRPARYTSIAYRLRKVRARPKARSWFDAYQAALLAHGDTYDKPLVDDHQFAEQLAGAAASGDVLADRTGYRTALGMVFLAGVMLALVTALAVSPSMPTTCAPPAPEPAHADA